MDGAGEFRIFATIAMRLMMPAQVTILLFQFVAIWNNYFLPLIMLSNENLFPLTVGLKNWGAPILVLPGALCTLAPLPVSVPLAIYSSDGHLLNDPRARAKLISASNESLWAYRVV